MMVEREPLPWPGPPDAADKNLRQLWEEVKDFWNG